MATIHFDEIKNLINSCGLATIDENPSLYESGQWELYNGKYRTHVIDVPFQLLYIKSDATKESIKKAARNAFKKNETFVVYAQSNKNKITLKEEFETARGFWNTTEYLASFMSNELSAYRNAIKKLSPTYYIDPVIQPPSGTEHRYPNPIHLFLTDPETTEDNGSVAVVLAEAGHGKTYMCESLVAKLAEKNTTVLPIFVSSSQWQRLRTEDLKSLATTIISSFRELGTPIPWVEGKEDLFLEVALKTGLFRIVFDGFDEYILRRPGGVSASETLEALAILAKKTGTRVVITSRTSFWKSEIAEYQRDIDNTLKIFTYNLQPFDTNLARNYFQLRFGNEHNKTERAVNIFRDLSKDDLHFAGRGFVLLLVADLVDSNDAFNNYGSEKPLIRLMYAHCDREQKRHKLHISPKQQMDALKHFVYEVSQGQDPNSELLLLSIQIVASDITEEDARATINKMMPHALIECKNGTWNIRQSQVEIALLAMQLIEYSNDKNISVLSNFSWKNLSPGSDSDLGAMLASLCYWGKDKPDAFNCVKNLISILFQASSLNQNSANIHTEVLRRLATLIILRIIDQESVQSHRDRSAMFVDFLPNKLYQGVIFFGGLAKFDWSGYTFNNCIFDNVRWSNCNFDKTTVFHECHLIGGSIQYCKGFSDIQWIECTSDESGRDFKTAELIKSGKKSYSEELLKTEISDVLEKFIGKGGVGFKSVGKTDIARGKISMSQHKNIILEELMRFILSEHHISGQEKKALNIKDEAKDAVRALFSNNIWTGSLSDLLELIKKKIGISE